MPNAKEEFLDEIARSTLKCAQIRYEGSCDEAKHIHANLPIDYSDNDFQLFLKTLDIDYDSDCWTQYLFGTIWYTDGTWSERAEYDGSEWWEYKSCPDIPEELNHA